jgi:hypothetical protein
LQGLVLDQDVFHRCHIWSHMKPYEATPSLPSLYFIWVEFTFPSPSLPYCWYVKVYKITCPAFQKNIWKFSVKWWNLAYVLVWIWKVINSVCQYGRM